MPNHPNPFVREGLVRRTALFGLALVAAFALVYTIAPDPHEVEDFAPAVAIAAILVALILLVPWRSVPEWLQVVPPLLYMVVIAELYAQGGGATSGFGTLFMLPILWLALYGRQAEMVVSIVASGVVVIGPQLMLGHAQNADAEYRRGILVVLVGTVMGFTVQRLVRRVRSHATQATVRADSLEQVTLRLRDAEERYRTMVEQLPLVTYIDALDDVSSAIYMSPQIEPLLGYSADEWLADKDLFVKLLHPDDRERVMERVARSNRSGEPFREEYRLIARDGRVVWFRDEAHHFKARDGSLRQMQGLMMDISDQKEDERRLRLQHSLATTIACAESLREATSELLSGICQAMDWDVGILWQADEQLGKLRCIDLWRSTNVRLERFESVTRAAVFAAGEGLAGKVWEDGIPRWYPEFRERSDFPRSPLLEDSDLHAAVAFAIGAAGRQLGVIEFFSREMREPDRKVMSLMAAIGAQLGQFIERMQAEERLREAEERYRQLVERIPAITYIASVGKSCKWLFVSPQIEDTLGYSTSEWTASDTLWYERLHEDDRERVMAAEHAVKELDQPLSVEYRMLARDGSVHWFRDEAVLVDDSSVPTGYLSGMMTDITAQKQTDHALRESEKRFRTLGIQAPVGIFELDPEGCCIFANDRWCEIAELTENQALGRGWITAVHPDDRERVAREWSESTGHDEGFETECRFLRPDGSVRWVTINAAALRPEPDQLSGFLGTVADITERKRSDRYHAIQHAVSKAIAESTTHDDVVERILVALGESMGWGLAAFWRSELEPAASGAVSRPAPLLRCSHTWSGDGIDGERFSETCRQMTFSSPLGMLGRVWEGGRGEWSAGLGQARSTRARVAVGLGMNGSLCLPVFGDSALLGIIEFFGRDVEDPGEIFLDVHSGVGRQVGEYIERKRGEAEAERAKDQFFALVSHELRTPLTSIIGYLELMEEESEMAEEERKRFLEIVHRNADRLLRLVGDLLLVAQVQAGKFSLRPGPVDLNAIASEAVEAARPQAEGRRIAIISKTDSLPVFVGDRDRIAQLFDNLITNALKFTDSGERIVIRTKRQGERAIVEVNNTGAVIPEAERSQLFDRFYRASDASTRVVSGVGLGLAIVKTIVEAHGGTIRVESNGADGTTFRFTLPLVRSLPGGLAHEQRAA